MCAVEIVVNAKDIAAIDFMTASIRKDIEESPYKNIKSSMWRFFLIIGLKVSKHANLVYECITSYTQLINN